MNQTDLKQRSHSQGLSNLMMIITPFPDFFSPPICSQSVW
jgi:hypothetical protein